MHAMDALFEPRRIVLFGASEARSVGGSVLRNLRAGGFSGKLELVNPKHDRVFGMACEPALRPSAVAPDLALIATPAEAVPGVLDQCAGAGVPVALVYVPGFGEDGAARHARAREVRAQAERTGIRLLGPDSSGLLRPGRRLDATFGPHVARPGNLAVVSQSGAICAAVLDWAETRDVGFSTMLSLGMAADIGFGEVLDYLAMDTATEAILLYVEAIRRTRRFMSGLRAAARLKPVIVLKAARFEPGRRAALSHTGALVGSDDVFAAALDRAGAVRADTIGELFDAAAMLARHRRVAGNRLTVITNAGGPGIMAADRAHQRGVRLASCDDDTLAALDRALPEAWSGANPVDLLGDADAERYGTAVHACGRDRASDALLVMNAPTAVDEHAAAAEAVIDAANALDKPVLACWLGETRSAHAHRRFAAARIPSFVTPEDAVDSFAFLARYSASQELLMQVPRATADPELPDLDGARRIIARALAEGREVLCERDSKALLSALRIPVNVTLRATDRDEAVRAAERIGFPVAMKIESPDVHHKTEVDGVRLDIENVSQVIDAFDALARALAERRPEARLGGVVVEAMVRRRFGRELMVGAFRDEAFGPAIVFGAGGTAVEVLADRSVGLPPLNAFLADRMMQGTRVAPMLGAFRNLPAVAEGVTREILLRLSDGLCELPELVEVDVNPLIVDDTGAVAVDARVVVRRTAIARPYEHLAVHPYPVHYRFERRLSDGSGLLIRVIRPEDAGSETRFMDSLSERSRYFRFMSAVRELSREMLVRFTQIDYDREMALVAFEEGPAGRRQIGVSRYVGDPDRSTCEFAVAVSDVRQGEGVGRSLMTHLIDIAGDQGFERMTGEILAENRAMLGLARSLGFAIRTHSDDPALRVATLPLRAAA